MEKKLAPVVLFVYNRPLHTEQTLAALEKNLLAPESDLFIYADGAKDKNAESKVAEVHKIIHKAWSFRSVTIIQRDRNWGLAPNVIDGVTTIINRYGKVIVLEDDLKTAPNALQYFNDSLNQYESQPQVMSVSGYNYPLKDADTLPETFFFRVTNSWGWATWDRAWKYFNPDIESLVQQLDQQQIYQFSIEGKENFWRQVQQFRKGTINSWAIRWYLSVFLQKGLTLYPRHSYIQNIGTDGSGTHSDAEQTYRVRLNEEKTTFFPEKIEENAIAYERIKNFYAHRKGSLFQRGIRFAKKWINKLNN
ncbi:MULTISPECIES: sugar transferase [unclassified Sphingobacterium]|uniref:sugar transferase n=1 Tax=unclassified Sphingobacterium TaxID=2609468 RepID=UPI0025E25A9E|nr:MULTISPECIES: sugar transferase [unclassified Sphingobacterium]